MRSVQGHSGGEQANPRLQHNELLRYGWSDYIYHVGSAYDYRSICDGGPGFPREGLQTLFSFQRLILW